MGIQRIVRHYKRQEIDPKALGLVRDVLSKSRMEWGHGKWGYQFHYPTQLVELSSADDIPAMISELGVSHRHYTYFKSTTGRFISVDTRNPLFVTVEISTLR